MSEKHPLDRITDAIETDCNYKQGEFPSKARMTFAWAKIMQSILKMPVPKWTEPSAVSGEISAAH